MIQKDEQLLGTSNVSWNFSLIYSRSFIPIYLQNYQLEIKRKIICFAIEIFLQK